MQAIRYGDEFTRIPEGRGWSYGQQVQDQRIDEDQGSNDLLGTIGAHLQAEVQSDWLGKRCIAKQLTTAQPESIPADELLRLVKERIQVRPLQRRPFRIGSPCFAAFWSLIQSLGSLWRSDQDHNFSTHLRHVIDPRQQFFQRTTSKFLKLL